MLKKDIRKGLFFASLGIASIQIFIGINFMFAGGSNPPGTIAFQILFALCAIPFTILMYFLSRVASLLFLMETIVLSFSIIMDIITGNLAFKPDNINFILYTIGPPLLLGCVGLHMSKKIYRLKSEDDES